MGKLTRRVKFIAKERRLSIPAEFLHRHGIERGDHLVAAAARDRLYVFDVATWDRYSQLAEHVGSWLPEQEQPFAAIVRNGARLRLGSQDRIVLPKSFPWSLEHSAKLMWDLVEGVLVLEAEHKQQLDRPALTPPTGQGSLLELLSGGQDQGPAFERDRAEDRHVESISVARIDFRDRRFASDSSIPGEPLLRSIKVEGVRRPVVLREIGGSFQIVDGFRRVAAARQLRMRALPAVVFRGLSDADCERIKLLEPPRDPAPEGSTLGRLQSTLRLHEDQVALKEIEHITGRRKRTLQRYLRVAQDPKIRAAIESGRLSIFKAEEILKAGIDPEEAVSRNWTVKQIREAGAGARSRLRRLHGQRRES